MVDKVSSFIQKTVDDTVEDTIDLADRAQKAMGKHRKDKKE
ncbi:hypothetical protein [Paenibacillus sp. 1_12]|nr:hypothetical protein [Paenibacillus sp. 1_12]